MIDIIKKFIGTVFIIFGFLSIFLGSLFFAAMGIWHIIQNWNLISFGDILYISLLVFGREFLAVAFGIILLMIGFGINEK